MGKAMSQFVLPTPAYLLLAGVFILGHAVLSPVECRAQQVTLRGFVTDARNGQTLPGANVTLRDSTGEIVGGVTDGDGFYQVSGLEAGQYLLRISFIGFEPHVDTLLLGDERYVTVSVALAESESELGEVVVESQLGAAQREAGHQTSRPSGDKSAGLLAGLQNAG